MKQKILFVDDDDQILKAMKRIFQNDKYQVYFANSGKAGLALLNEHKAMGVIISDMRMPEMDGVEFLKEAQKICPDAIAMIISAYSDKESLIKSINESHIWKYILKPWEIEDVRQSVKNAFHLYEQIMQNKGLLGILDRVNTKVEKLNAALSNKNKRIQQEMKYHYPNKIKKRRYGDK